MNQELKPAESFTELHAANKLLRQRLTRASQCDRAKLVSEIAEWLELNCGYELTLAQRLREKYSV